VGPRRNPRNRAAQLYRFEEGIGAFGCAALVEVGADLADGDESGLPFGRGRTYAGGNCNIGISCETQGVKFGEVFPTFGRLGGVGQ
jgi:hypothetical protein